MLKNSIKKLTIKLWVLTVFLFVSGSILADSEKAEFVGVSVCVQCHQQQTKAWRGSHHDRAMQHANTKTVLGNFNNQKFTYYKITSTFFKKGEQFFVNTDGPTGKLQNFQIKYTFGVEPLQQYLIELPGGRLQALGIAWDSRPAAKGGQRWYHLYADQNVTHNNRLHWTGADQNWNFMCADCHSTHLEKNYNIESNRFKTSWSEINVACEACHGPASIHVDWANKTKGWEQHNKDKGLVVAFHERSGVSWNLNADSGNSVRSKIKNTDIEIEICARCHSRRNTISQHYAHDKPLLDNYQPALLTEFLYYPDGQIKNEDYVYGSFVQSKMYHKGVTCSDCHEPHSLNLRANGNDVCLQCHAADKFDKSSHHFHSKDSEGASCVECHMPQTIYMGVDGRHDHSIRIPRPDLSLSLKTPNACNQCHKTKTVQWANKKMQGWYGKRWPPGWHFGETLFEAQHFKPGVGQDLAAVAASPKIPSIARATVAYMLQDFPGRITTLVTQKLLSDKNDLVRLSALHTLDKFDLTTRLRLGFHLLSDPVLAVRIEAARIMSITPKNMLSDQQQKILKSAIAEYMEAQLANADRPEAHINMGLINLRMGRYAAAIKNYQQALKIDSGYVSAYINLADLYRAQQLENKVQEMLNLALQYSAEDSIQAADVYHALGLFFIRQKKMKKALNALSKSVRLQPDNTRYAYVYAVALNNEGQTNKAITLLRKTIKVNPGDADSLIALISFYKQLGDKKSARIMAQKLLTVRPDYGTVQSVMESL